MELILIIIYTLALSFVFLYSIVQLNLAYNFLFDRKTPLPPPPIKNENLPFVTIQLPLYNELYVVERLIDSITQFDYPKNKFEIQILDDSTDETVSIVAKKVEEYQAKGFHIYQHKRVDRKGYKAGALLEGTQIAKGEFI